MADTKPGIGASAALTRYWTEGAGKAKWASSPKPYTTLVALLLKAGVPPNMVHGLAAEYYKRVFGHSPGKQNGSKG